MNQAEVTLLVRAKDEASKVFAGIKGHAQSLGQTMSSVLKVGALAAGGGILAAGAAAVKFIGDASNLAESLSKVRVVFGENSREIETWAAGAAQNMGQTKQQALEMAGTFGNLFDALGLSQEKALGMSKSVVELGTDLASFNNISTGEALEKLRAGLVGEAEPLRALGVNLTAATTEAKAMQLGLEQVNGEFTDAAKVQARYALILEQTGNAQGDFARTSEGLANQQRILGAEWGNLKAQIGTALMPVMLLFVGVLAREVVPAIASAASHFGNFVEVIQAALSGDVAKAAALFATLPGPLQQIALWLAENREEIIGFLAGVRDLAVIIGGVLLDALRGWLSIVQAVAPHLIRLGAFIADHRPLLIALAVAVGILVVALVGVPAVILAVIVAVGLLADKWDEIQAKTLEVWNGIVGFLEERFGFLVLLVRFQFATILNIVTTAIYAVRDVINIVMALLRGDWDAVWEGIKQLAVDLFDGLVTDIALKLGFMRDVFELAMGAIAGSLGDRFTSMVNGAKDVVYFLKDAFYSLRDAAFALRDAIDSIPNPLGKLGGLADKLGSVGKVARGLTFAAGGVMPYTGLALVGERGPELVALPGGSRVYNNDDSQRMMAAQSSVVMNGVTIVLPNVREPQDFGRELDRYFR